MNHVFIGILVFDWPETYKNNIPRVLFAFVWSGSVSHRCICSACVAEDKLASVRWCNFLLLRSFLCVVSWYFAYFSICYTGLLEGKMFTQWSINCPDVWSVLMNGLTRALWVLDPFSSLFTNKLHTWCVLTVDVVNPMTLIVRFSQARGLGLTKHMTIFSIFSYEWAVDTWCQGFLMGHYKL